MFTRVCCGYVYFTFGLICSKRSHCANVQCSSVGLYVRCFTVMVWEYLCADLTLCSVMCLMGLMCVCIVGRVCVCVRMRECDLVCVCLCV